MKPDLLFCAVFFSLFLPTLISSGWLNTGQEHRDVCVVQGSIKKAATAAE